MSPLCRSISDTELAVLKALWEVGEATVRDLQEHLSVAGFNWAYTTVQTLLNRLEHKECVASTKHGRAFRFCVTTTRDDLLHRELGDLAERVCGGAALPLVMSLVEHTRFSKVEIKRLRDLLDDLEQPSKKKSKRKPRTHSLARRSAR